MLNLTGLQTAGEGKYDLARVDPKLAEGNAFLRHLLSNRQVIYHWGRADFYVCEVPFHVNYDQGTILTKAGNLPIQERQWMQCDSTQLRELLAPVLEGEAGFTSTDEVAIMIRSGVTIDLCGCEKYGPPDPQEYLKNLKKVLAHHESQTKGD